MPRVCRANIDKAGGVIMGGSSTVFIDGFPVALVGNRVQSHGDSPHKNAIMINGSSKFIVDGIAVCLESISKATCGHPAVSTSSVTAS